MRGPAGAATGAALVVALAGAIALGDPGTAGDPGAGSASGAAPDTAAPVRLSLRAEPARVTVGDPVIVSLEITYPEGYDVGTPSPRAEWGALAVAEVKRGEPRRAADGGWVRVDRIMVAAFATGDVQAPPLTLQFRGPDGSVGEVSTPPLDLSVESVLPPGGKAEIADLKGPASLPRPLWPWILAAGALMATAGGGGWYLAWRRRRRLAALMEASAGPPLPPYEWAVEQLERLAASDLLASGRWLDYHVVLAEVVKEYLTRRFNIPTLERTTGEVLAGARAARLGGGLVADLRSVLEPCDLVKFARHRPARAEAEAVLERARGLVEATRPAPETAPVVAAS